MIGNTLRGRASLRCGAETYHLTFDIDALCLLEQATGADLATIFDEALSAAPRLSHLRCLLWAGLVRVHPDIEIRAAGRIIETIGLGGAQTALLEGLQAAIGSEDGADPDRKRDSADKWDWVTLYSSWCEAGFEPDKFWLQTPRLLKAALAGYGARLKNQYRIAMSQAWHAAALPHFKKGIPPLYEVLGDPKPMKRAQDNAEMLAVMRRLAAKGKATIREIPPEEALRMRNAAIARREALV